MTQAVQFGSTTPRYSLPLLFAGQAQKEFYVNGALGSLDALIHTCVIGASDMPPIDPFEGDIWLVSANAQGEWSGHVDKLAVYSTSSWSFIIPLQGMRIFDNALGRFMHFDGSWRGPSSVNSPKGGTVIDVEARTTIDELILALQNAGIFERA